MTQHAQNFQAYLDKQVPPLPLKTKVVSFNHMGDYVAVLVQMPDLPHQPPKPLSFVGQAPKAFSDPFWFLTYGRICEWQNGYIESGMPA